MNSTIKATWDLLIETTKKTDVSAYLNEDAFDDYKEQFDYWYNTIKNKYMNSDVDLSMC